MMVCALLTVAIEKHFGQLHLDCLVQRYTYYSHGSIHKLLNKRDISTYIICVCGGGGGGGGGST